MGVGLGVALGTGASASADPTPTDPAPAGPAPAGPGAAGPAPAGAGSADPVTSGQAGDQDAAGRHRPAPTGRVYLGTYTSSGGGTGIGLGRYDLTTGQLTATGVLAGVADPSFLTFDRTGRRLYAVNEQAAGRVTAIAVDEAGAPRVLNAQSTGGDSPCHLCVHPSGRYVISANYGSGSLSTHPVRADGSLGARTDLVRHTGSGPDPDRQAGPHAHMVLTDPAGRYVLAVDLGTDSVYAYELNLGTGRLRLAARSATRPGAGPRHLAFHPNGRFAYVANELDSTIAVAAYAPATGRLTFGQTQPTSPNGDAGVRNYPAEVLVSADGRFVYLSNRGHDTIAVFAVEQGGAALRLLATPPVGGKFPRHISFDPTGSLLFAANQNSGTVTSFRVDRASGALTPSGTPLAAPTPVCVIAT